MIYYKFTQLESIYYFCEIDYVFKTEQWKDIPDYEGMYSVSDLGRIKSFKCGKQKMLKSGIGNNGYLNVVLCGKSKNITRNVHKIVAICFLNHVPCGRKLVIDHKDNNRLNNKSVNLQITTTRVNTSKDRHKIPYSSNYVGVNWSKQAKKWRAEISVNGKIKYLGLFNIELEAFNAYKKALQELL